MRIAALIGLALIALAFALPAQAQTAVTLPVGDWIGNAVDVLFGLVMPAIAAFMAWILRRVPSAVADVLVMIRVEQLLLRATTYGLNAVKGAAANRTLTVDLGNAVLAEAVGYAIRQAPNLVQWAGGERALAEKIIARLNLEPDVGVWTASNDLPVLEK